MRPNYINKTLLKNHVGRNHTICCVEQFEIERKIIHFREKPKKWCNSRTCWCKLHILIDKLYILVEYISIPKCVHLMWGQIWVAIDLSVSQSSDSINEWMNQSWITKVGQELLGQLKYFGIKAALGYYKEWKKWKSCW